MTAIDDNGTWKLAGIQSVTAVYGGQPADTAPFESAIEEGIAGLDWHGREGMSDEFARHLGAVILRDVLEQALAAAKGGAA